MLHDSIKANARGRPCRYTSMMEPQPTDTDLPRISRHDTGPLNIVDHQAQIGVLPSSGPLQHKARLALESHRLKIAKNWLNRMISEIEDLRTLETFPAQESIKASLEILEGLALALDDDRVLDEFEPGGAYYEKSASMGLVGSGTAADIISVARNMHALESAIWELMVDTLRREDQNVLRLVMRLRRGLNGVSMAAAEACYARASGELDRMAYTDVLTGLFNRRHLLRELERNTEIYKRYHHPFSLIMLDLDNLKGLNDTYGHAAGDSALRHVAAVMKASTRDVDVACRWGGDEFMILMPETEKRVVEIVAARIDESLRNTKLKVDSGLLTLEVSVGSSSCPVDGTESEMLLQ